MPIPFQCPMCEHWTTGAPGDEVVCGQCGARFRPPAPGAAPHSARPPPPIPSLQRRPPGASLAFLAVAVGAGLLLLWGEGGVAPLGFGAGLVLWLLGGLAAAAVLRLVSPAVNLWMVAGVMLLLALLASAAYFGFTRVFAAGG